jgi:DNA invertase Pin-like site-specific DNA recombinase
MRVFGYSRVSTAEQADGGASLDVQQQQIMGYCLMKGYALAEHFVERGVSGSIPLADRPEGKRLLATIGKGDVVISAKLDRAFRSAADALAVLEEFKDQGVDLHLIDLGGSVMPTACRRWCSPSWPRWPRASATGCASASVTPGGT